MAVNDLLRLLPFERYQNPAPVVSVVRLQGMIAAGGMPLRRGSLNLQGLAAALERAFKLPNLKAVALAVNSPGGSPVQSSLIYKRIRALAAEKEIPVVAFAEDVAASGGYWLACAADEIFADESSIIGSIGVIYAGFGFQDLIARYGIERRVHTAGADKSTLDPFRPEKPEDVERLTQAQADIHAAFMDAVRARRAGALKAPEDELFTGEFWTGKRALELGLIDGIGDLRTVMRERYGERVRLVVVGSRQAWLRRRIGLTRETRDWSTGSFADDMVDGALAALERRALWARFGL